MAENRAKDSYECSWYREKLSLYVMFSPDLPDDEFTKIDQHLLSCPQCSREYQKLLKEFNISENKRAESTPEIPSMRESWKKLKRKLFGKSE